MKTLLSLFSAIGIATLLTSCATRTTVVIDRSSDVVRIGPGMKGCVYVWSKDKKTWIDGGKTTLPEGWFAGPGPK